MKKVITINLNGQAYQVETAAYDSLREYLKVAEARLHDNPDRDEIMADFEQAVADKCRQYLGKTKTVVTESEITKIIGEMGPVKADEPNGGDENTRAEEPETRRLYQIHDDAIVCGVCAGVAAYLNVDVTVVRLVVILLTFFTGGFVILIYIALALLLPAAKTPEQKAAAMGQRFNAEDIIDRAKAKYADLADNDHWKSVAANSRPAFDNIGSAILKCLRVAAGCVAAVGGLAAVAIGAGWIASVWSIALTARVFGYTLDPSMPAWLLGVFVTGAVYIVALPILVVTIVAWTYARRGHVRTNVWWPIAGLSLLAVAIGICIAVPLESPQIRNAVQNHQGHINLGEKTICVGSDQYCHRLGDDMAHIKIIRPRMRLEQMMNSPSAVPQAPSPPIK